MSERKIPVYLSEHDWKSVLACLLSHANEQRPGIGATTWEVGRNRIRYIVDQIEARLPKRDAA